MLLRPVNCEPLCEYLQAVANQLGQQQLKELDLGQRHLKVRWQLSIVRLNQSLSTRHAVRMTRLLHLMLNAIVLLSVSQASVAGAQLVAGPGGNATRAVTKLLSRQKRYLAFPEGSSVSV